MTNYDDDHNNLWSTIPMRNSPRSADQSPALGPAGLSRSRRPQPRGEETRARILRSAARAIRIHGPAGIGVLEIMREAGLTHGGFYSHFASKDALVAAAITAMFAESRERFVSRVAGKTGRDALRTWINAYVSAEHRDNPGGGCTLATLISDMPRLDPAARAAFDEGLRGIASRLARHLSAQPDAKTKALAHSLICEMAGAVALARAVSDRDFSDAILKNARAALQARLAEDGA